MLFAKTIRLFDRLLAYKMGLGNALSARNRCIAAASSRVAAVTADNISPNVIAVQRF
jgi:hypothetical protein